MTYELTADLVLCCSFCYKRVLVMEIVEEGNADCVEAGEGKCLFQGSVIFTLGTDVGELIRALTVFQVSVV